MLANSRKAIITFVLTAMFLTGFSLHLYAEGNEHTNLTSDDNLLLEVGTAQGSNIEYVTIPIRISNVPKDGINLFNFRMCFNPEKLEILDIIAGDIIKNPETNFATGSGSQKGRIGFSFEDRTFLGEENITDDGIFATLKVRIKTPEINDVLLIETISHDIRNYDMDILPLNYVHGKIILGKTDALEDDKNISVEIGEASGAKGDIVEIPIEYSNIPKCGINSLSYELIYNNEDIDIIDLVPGNIIANPQDDLTVSVNSDNGIIYFEYINTSKDKEKMLTIDGTFATILAKIKSESLKFSPIEFSKNIPYFKNYDSIKFPSVFKAGGVEIDETITIPLPENTMVLKIGKAKGVKGDIVDIPINFFNMESVGLNNCSFFVSYDKEELELLDIFAGDIIENQLYQSYFSSYIHYDRGTVSFLYSNSFTIENVLKNDGEFAKMRFKIKSEETNSISPVTFLESTDFADYDLNPISLIYENGKVIIGETPEIPSKTIIEIGDASGFIGETIQIPLKFKSIPTYGVGDFNFDLKYNSLDLEIISIEEAELMGNIKDSFSYTLKQNGQIRFSFLGNSEDEIFAWIVAKITPEATTGRSEIYCLPITRQIYPSNFQSIHVKSNGIVIEEMPKQILGDLNGDGQINTIDYALLTKYVREIIDEFPIKNGLEIADLNKDGSINSVDCTLLKRNILEIIQ